MKCPNLLRAMLTKEVSNELVLDCDSVWVIDA